MEDEDAMQHEGELRLPGQRLRRPRRRIVAPRPIAATRRSSSVDPAQQLPSLQQMWTSLRPANQSELKKYADPRLGYKNGQRDIDAQPTVNRARQPPTQLSTSWRACRDVVVVGGGIEHGYQSCITRGTMRHG
jgi:hypothetical protein